MDAPPVQYVKTSDGYSIAYSVCGEGEPLVVAPPTFHHLQLVWEEEAQGRWLRNLAARYKLVLHDHRGTGLSGRGLPNYRPLDRVVDIEAVVDRVDLGQFVLLGIGSSCHPAVLYAVRHPERVGALILISCYVANMPARSPALYQDLARDDWETFLHLVSQRPEGLAATSQTIDSRKHMVDKADFLLFTSASSSIEDELGSVSAPTLVIHPREVGAPSREDCAEVASRIPQAQMVVVDGGGPSRIGGYNDSVVGAIESFLADLPSPVSQSASSSSDTQLGSLSVREIEVLRLVAAGQTNQQIADALVISRNTVRRHVSNIFDKTGIINRAQAGVYAREHGIV